jgi:hypothetical protein
VIAALAPDAMPDIDLKHLMTAGEFKALLAQPGWSTSDLLLQ